MEGIGILHGELPYPDKSCPWSWVIPPLGLDLINHYWKSLVGVDFSTGTVCDSLFVGHGQYHVPSASVLESSHFLVDGVPASCLLPDICRIDDAHEDLLSSDSIHLFTDDGLNLLCGSHSKRKHGKYTGAQLADESSSKKVFISLAVCTVWRFAKGLCKHFGHSHRSTISLKAL